MEWVEIQQRHQRDWVEYEYFREKSYNEMQERHLTTRQHYKEKGQLPPVTATYSMKKEFEEWFKMWGPDGERVNQLYKNHLFVREEYLKRYENNPKVQQQIQQSIEQLKLDHNKHSYLQFGPMPPIQTGLWGTFHKWYSTVLNLLDRTIPILLIFSFHCKI